MKTIFGEEHFLDNTMCEIFYEKNKEIDDYILDNIYATSTKIGITVDKDKLRRWLILCGQLEQIDKSDLIDIAIKKKFDEKDHRIAVLEKENQNLKLELEIGRPLIAALEEKAISLPYDRNIAVLEKALDLACESVYYPNARPFDRNTSNAKYFIDQAEKELKDEKL